MDVFVAREPIFDSNQNVFAYELLFRNGYHYPFSFWDGDRATSSVLASSFISIGLETLTRGRLGFVNFTRNLLLDNVIYIFPKHSIGIEILESVEPDNEILSACKNLKNSGYTLVLDDFTYHPKYTPLLPFIDMVKVDFLKSDFAIRREVVKRVNSKRIKLVAEKIQKKDDFEQAKDLGYSYFQGYFFCKPQVISGKDTPGYKKTYLRILHEVNLPEANFNKIENIIKYDVSLSYKLLRLINSAAFGFYNKIESIKQTLVLLGLREIRKWISLIAVSYLGKDKPDELIIKSLVRASFLEKIASRVKMSDRSSDLFLMGLFSLIDVLLDRPKKDILQELPISNTIKDALLDIRNEFSDLYHLVITYESGKWPQFSKYASKLAIDEKEIPSIYFSALENANLIFKAN